MPERASTGESDYRSLIRGRRAAIAWELGIIGFLAACVFLAAHRLHIFHAAADWVIRREQTLPGEIVVTLVFLSFLLVVFAYRHWRDLRHEIAARHQTEETLQGLRKQLEEQVEASTAAELRDSEARYRELFDKSPLPMWLYDEESLSFVEVNQAAIEHYGYSDSEFRAMTLKDIRPPEEVSRLLVAVDQEEKPARWHPNVWKHRKKDGTEIAVDVHTHRVSSGGRRISLAVIRDVTQERRLEEQLHQSQKMEAIGELAGGVAHDFNNLLTTILGFADLALGHIAPRTALCEDIEEIVNAGQRASALTRQLLAFSRKQLLEPTILDLREVVAEMDKMLRRLLGERIDLRSVVSPELWRMKADRGQIEQVIMNLAVNARDAMPKGGSLTIEAMNVELDSAYADTHLGVQPGRHVLIAVSDNGMGMDAATQGRIFEPFFTTKEKGKGTGLGLSTVYGIVKQSGGHIAVYSEPGKGTTFKVYVPQSKEEAPLRPLEVELRPKGGSETILLIEDEDPVRRLTRRILEEYGYKVLEAESGEAAITKAEEPEETVHLVLSDAVLPGMEVGEILDRLEILHPEAKVLLMSGYTDEAVLRHHIRKEGTSFLPKPFTAQGLAGKVREVLDAGPQVRR